MRAIQPILLMNLLASVALGAPAHAGEIVCGLVEKDLISVDGLLDDWSGVAAQKTQGADGARDALLSIRCNYDADTLYLAVEVTDDQLIRRGKKDKGAEDMIVLVFGSSRLEVLPSDTDHDLAMKSRWADGGSTKALAIADSLLPKGWAVEYGLPRGRVPGWDKGVTAIPLIIELHDADLYSESKHQEVLRSGGEGSVFTLEEGASLYTQFLDDMRLKPKDIWLDQMANMDGEPGNERVVIGNRTVGILGESYSYMQFPVHKKDLLTVKIVDLAGEGKSAILAHYVERGNGGLREVLAVWVMLPDGSFTRPFAHEVAKESPEGRMTNAWSLEPKAPPADAKPAKKGKKPKKPKGKPAKGFDIVLVPGELRGFTAEAWNEIPASDMAPILLPWAEVKRERWRFQGDESSGGPDESLQ